MYLSGFNSSLDTLPSPPQLVSRNLTSPADEACYDIRYCRTISNIIWSCVATILACTWVAIHPNIPPQDAGWMSKLGRRIVTTIYAIIAPEVVVLWAVKQWIMSTRLAHKYRGLHKWTQTHGFFALIGGFVIYKNDKLLRVVDPYLHLDRLGSTTPKSTCKSCASFEKRLSEHHCGCCINQASALNPLESHCRAGDTSRYDQLDPGQMPLIHAVPESESGSEESRPDIRRSSDAGHPLVNDKEAISTLSFPDISQAEIMNMSKGNWISKGLAILQTSWFIMQCIARTMQKLPVTELELATCAFAALNAVTYGLWWNKPQSVDCPYPLGRQSVTNPRPSNIVVTSRCRRKNIKSYINGILKIVWCKQTLSTFHIDEHSDMAMLLGMLVLLPLAPLDGMMSGDDISTDSTHVPPYYAGNLSGRDRIMSTLAVVACSTVFGAIHCIGWTFEFPSRGDQLLWRSCSLAITCLPLIEAVLLLLGLLGYFDNRVAVVGDIDIEILVYGLIAINLILYIAARVTLLVLAFVALKVLSPAAYQTVSWTNFIPHI